MATKTATSADATRPNAPKHMSPSAKKRWEAKYDATLEQAKLDYPENDRAQRNAAHKAANTLLSVPAPDSAAAIDKLEGWQVKLRETRMVEGVSTRVCVTSDGRKYSFEIPASK